MVKNKGRYRNRIKQLKPLDIDRALSNWQNRGPVSNAMVEERRKHLLRVLFFSKQAQLDPACPQDSNEWAGIQGPEIQAPIDGKQPKIDRAQGFFADGVDGGSFSDEEAFLSSPRVAEIAKSVIEKLISYVQNTAQESQAGAELTPLSRFLGPEPQYQASVGTVNDDTAQYSPRRQRITDLENIPLHDCTTSPKHLRGQPALIRSTSEKTKETEEGTEVALGRKIDRLRKEKKQWKEIITACPGQSKYKCEKALQRYRQKQRQVAELYQRYVNSIPVSLLLWLTTSRSLPTIWKSIAEDVGVSCNEVHEMIRSLGDNELATCAIGERAT